MELQLITGLVAHYAYNVDVPNSYDLTMNALDKAQKMHPEDVRGPWFHATMACQTAQPKAGAEEFLAIENTHAWDQLPVAFWDDYMECTSVTNMPAHQLRAAKYLTNMHAPDSAMRSYLIKTAQNQFVPFDPQKTYAPKEAWWAKDLGNDMEFTGTSCGLRFHTRAAWTIENIGLSSEGCVAVFNTGPYKAVSGKLSPEILVLVKQPKENETIQDFAVRFTRKGTFETLPAVHCPTTNCIAMKGIQPQMYGKNGDGHGRVVVFQQEQPPFPGLIFESPMGPPKPNNKSGASYYRPNQAQQRMPGKLYYLILLDTASSIEDPALKDFEFFLQNIEVE